MKEAQPSVYQKQTLPEPSPDLFWRVYVTDVRSPSKFSIQLFGKSTTEVLESLQEDMTAFYMRMKNGSYDIEEVYPGQVI